MIGWCGLQRQAELQGEADLRVTTAWDIDALNSLMRAVQLKTGHLERVVQAVSEARRVKNADVQKAEVAKNEQKAQIASVEAAKIELEQDEASAQLERQASEQERISARTAARISRDKQAVTVGQEKAQLAGELT